MAMLIQLKKPVLQTHYAQNNSILIGQRKNMQKPQKKQQRAFTLLELLIVMVILAILAGLGLMAFGTVQMKSRDSRRKQDLVNISKALETYYNDYGTYPGSNSVGDILGCGAGGTAACRWGDPWQDDKRTLYISALPQDPSSNQNYFYDQIDDNSFYLFARLENELDKDAAVNGGNPSFYHGYSCDSTARAGLASGCNYVIMSTNLINKPAVD